MSDLTDEIHNVTDDTAPVGVVYLLHLDEPFGPPHQQAKHYTGWARNLAKRLEHHANGTGANLLRHVRAAGIGWELVRTWENATKSDERRLKNRGGARRHCPKCLASV